MEYTVATIENNNKVWVESAGVRSYPAHIHTYSEMILYEPFDGTVIINDLHIQADSGCAVLIVPSDLHRIVVNRSMNAGYMKVAFHSRPTDHSVVLRKPDNERFLMGVFEEIKNGRDSDEYVQLLAQTAEYILQEKGERISPLEKNTQNDLAIQTVRIIKEHAYEPITLASVAEDLFVSAPYLSKVFKQTTGMCFSSYLSNMRLDRAADLLCKTRKSVTEICIESGFHNLSHFIRSFHRRFGCAPAAFRGIKNTRA